MGAPRKGRQVSLARSGMDRRAGRDSRHHQKGFGERGQGEVTAVDQLDPFGCLKPAHVAAFCLDNLSRYLPTYDV